MILLVLFAITCGYWWGRRAGYNQGKKLGLRLAVFHLKSETLKKGICPVCSHGPRQELRVEVTKDRVSENKKQEVNPLHSIAFEFDTEQDMRQTAEELWKKHEITGELEMFPTDSGKFRLHVYSEKKIKESVLEKITAKRIHAKGSYGAAVPKEESGEETLKKLPVEKQQDVN